MRRRRRNTKKTFERQMIDVGLGPNIVAGLVVTFFVTLLSGIPVEKAFPIVVFALGVVSVLQFIVAPITNRLITKGLSDDLEDLERYETTSRERTRLLKRLMSCPQKVALQVFLVFGFGAVFWVSSFKWFFHFNDETFLLSLASVLIGAYIAMVLSMSYSQLMDVKLLPWGLIKKKFIEDTLLVYLLFTWFCSIFYFLLF